MAAPQNKGQGQAGGPIHAPGNVASIPATMKGTMAGKPINIPDAPTVNGAGQPYPPVREVNLGVVNDQEF